MIRIAAAMVAAVLVLGACSSDDDDGDAASDDTTSTTVAGTDLPGTTVAGQSATTVAGSASAADVTIKGFAFTTKPVKAGAKVTIKNEDSATHTFTADDGSFNSGNVDAGKTDDITAPSQAGDYKVHCEIHSSMTGTLTVT
jgi:plastocyanin